MLTTIEIKAPKSNKNLTNLPKKFREFSPSLIRLYQAGTEVEKTIYPFYKVHTEGFTDLGKLNFPMVVRLRLEPIFNTAPAA